LAQIGQEELGKSVLLLCGVAFDSKEQWREFWRRWKNHDAKAHMAFWYEWLDPLRFSVSDPEGRSFDGAPVRKLFSDEKEAGLYVDFDDEMEAFVLPAWRVPAVEAYGRIGALGTLALTAAGIHDVLHARDTEFRTTVLSQHLLRLWNGFVPQDEMLAALRAFADQSELHASFLSDLRSQFAKNRSTFRGHLRADALTNAENGMDY
jgi:AbiV family abortive infection protein